MLCIGVSAFTSPLERSKVSLALLGEAKYRISVFDLKVKNRNSVFEQLDIKKALTFMIGAFSLKYSLRVRACFEICR